MSPSLLFALLSLTIPVGGEWFYPGAGDVMVRLEQGPGGLHINGFPVERTGYLLARVADGAALRALAAMPEVAEVEVLRGDGHVVRVRPRGGAGVDELTLSRWLRERHLAVWAHPDFLVETAPSGLPNDPYVSGEWHLTNVGQRGWTRGVDINAELAWTRNIGTGAIAAVIDTGVDAKHPDLRATLGHDYIDRDEDSSPVIKLDGAPHGTAVSGIIAAVGNNGIGVAGVAYGASVYGIRLIGGKSSSLGDMYGAFIEAVDAGAWVLNNSWGYGDKCNPVPDFGVYSESMIYAETMGRGGLGAAVVFAAGNGNCDIGKDGLLGQPEVIAVAATNGDDLREDYSNFGIHVDVAAPSGTILTTDIHGKDGYGSWSGDDNYYGTFSGTSAAAPVVSGVVMLMFGANPRLTAAQARRVLCQTAAKIDIKNAGYDEKGWSRYYGCGRVDAGAAVMAVANSAPAAPVIVAPLGQAWSERVLLQWQPAADADDDWLAYRVVWHIDGRGEDQSVDVRSGETSLDLTKSVKVGDSVTFTVQAVDLWGPGGASAPTTFAVVDHPVPLPPLAMPGGCACQLGHRAALPAWSILIGAGLFLLLFLLQRRRRRALTPTISH